MHLLQCFSCFAASALESDCKDTKLFPTGKIIHDNSRPFAVIRVKKRSHVPYPVHRSSKGLQKALGIPPDGSHWNPGAATLGMPVAFRINMYPHHSPSVPAPTVHRLFNGFLSERGRRGSGADTFLCGMPLAFLMERVQTGAGVPMAPIWGYAEGLLKTF